MTSVNVILFTECVTGKYYFRTAGPYRLATEVRNAGYTCQTIDFFTFYTFEEYQKIIDLYVGPDTLVIGFSTTFLSKISSDIIDHSSNIEDELSARANNLMTRKHNRTTCGFKHENFKKLISMFKQKNPDIKIVIGGGYAHEFYDDTMDVKRMYGYAENEFMNYLKSIDKKENNLTLQDFDFNQSQILWHESDHIFPNEALPIEISRGCIFKCAFCNFKLNGKKKFDYIKEPKILKEELIRNYELFGTTSYIFCDDTFNDSTYKLELLFNEVVSKLPFKLDIATYARLDLLNAHREQIQLLSDIGVKHLFCGIETINAESQKYIGKHLPLEKLQDVLTYIKTYHNDIKISGLFIFGLPYENKETLETMRDWLMQHGLDYFSHVYGVPLNISPNGTSKISKTFKDLGYNLYNNDGITKWVHKNGLTYDECLSMSLECNNYIRNNASELHGFYYIMDKNLKHFQNDDKSLSPLVSVINDYKKNILKYNSNK